MPSVNAPPIRRVSGPPALAFTQRWRL